MVKRNDLVTCSQGFDSLAPSGSVDHCARGKTISAFACDASIDSRDHTFAARGILEAALRVLIAHQLEAISPQLLVPRALDQAAALNAVAHSQRHGVGGVQQRHCGP
jgi:hypothetical protein